MAAKASGEYDTGADVTVPTFGRPRGGMVMDVSFATGVFPLSITTVSPFWTSRINRERCVFAS